MPRQARTASGTGIYHIMMRGVNRRNIFDDDEDRQRFVQILGGLLFQYIREEIEADVIGKELAKIFSQEEREPTIQEIMDASRKAKQKADLLLGIKS